MADDIERLSRFIDLSKRDGESFPADIARFEPAAQSARPEQVFYEGPGEERVAVECFDIGLVVAGAVSAGAYSAGVLDYLVEVLDDWERAKEKDAKAHGADFARWSVPPHAVRIRVVAGASAGSVCAALMAVASQRHFLPVKATDSNLAEPDDPRTDNPFYDLWVNRLDIRGMLATDDIGASTTFSTLPSLLNSLPIRRAADSVLEPPAPTPEGRAFPERRRYIADPLAVALSIANLNGIPFCYRFEGLEGARFATVKHADAMRFLVHAHSEPEPPETAPGGFVPLTGAASSASKTWVAFADATLASGAFPVAFAPIWLLKNPDAYRFELRPRVDLASTPATRWVQTAKVSAGYSEVSGAISDGFHSVDGGTMNNQPFQFARAVLTGPLGDLDGEGPTARKAMMIIDPFPASAPEEAAVNAGPAPIGILGSVGRLFRAWINQARFDANDLALAADPDIYSRFMLSPMRARISAATGQKGETALGAAAIASGALGGFSGFLSVRFRHHDFLLGRRNAENFLRNYFSLPEGNSLFQADWWKAQSDDGKDRQRPLTAEPGTAKAHERLIVPPLAALARKSMRMGDSRRTSADETTRKQFVRDTLAEASPVWPGTDKLPRFNPDSIAHLFEARTDAVLDLALSDFLSSVPGFLRAIVRRVLTNRVSPMLVKQLREALEAHRLNDPNG